VQPRVYRTGEDVLFDCDLRTNATVATQKKVGTAEVARI
jgi:hypothetical protein